jgi:hypothetical protein
LPFCYVQRFRKQTHLYMSRVPFLPVGLDQTFMLFYRALSWSSKFMSYMWQIMLCCRLRQNVLPFRSPHSHLHFYLLSIVIDGGRSYPKKITINFQGSSTFIIDKNTDRKFMYILRFEHIHNSLLSIRPNEEWLGIIHIYLLWSNMASMSASILYYCFNSI